MNVDVDVDMDVDVDVDADAHADVYVLGWGGHCRFGQHKTIFCCDL